MKRESQLVVVYGYIDFDEGDYLNENSLVCGVVDFIWNFRFNKNNS